MQLTSKWRQGPVFWRTFSKGDTVYIIGRFQNFLNYGESVDLNLPEGEFQFELKRVGLSGPMIMHPGRIWTNGDPTVVLLNDGRLVSEEEGTSVVVDPNWQTSYIGSVNQFFNRLSAEADLVTQVTVSMASSVAGATTSTAMLSAETSDVTVNQAGAKLTVAGTVQNVSINFEGNASVTQTITEKVARQITTVTTKEVKNSLSTNQVFTITIPARKFTIYTYSWQRVFITGTVEDIYGNIIPFSAPIEFRESKSESVFDSIDHLKNSAPRLYDDYRRNFPNAPV